MEEQVDNRKQNSWQNNQYIMFDPIGGDHNISTDCVEQHTGSNSRTLWRRRGNKQMGQQECIVCFTGYCMGDVYNHVGDRAISAGLEHRC